MSKQSEATTMAIIRMGYEQYVLPLRDAVTMAELLTNAERYDDKYKEGSTTHHIWREEANHPEFSIKVMSQTFYQTAKLAGKPAQ